MRVLSAIVITPELQVSGAVNAALALSDELGSYCTMHIALMANRTAVSKKKNARLMEVRSRNILFFTQGFLPPKVRTLFYRSSIPDLIEHGSYDLVHIHNVIPAMEMKRIAARCLKLKIPYVVSTHGFVETHSKGEAYQVQSIVEKTVWRLLIEKPIEFVVRHARMIFALTPYDSDILHHYDLPKERIGLVPNGVNEAYFERPGRSVYATTLQKFSLSDPKDTSVPVCIYLGNHTKNKGVEFLLSTFLRWQKPYILIVAGSKRPSIPYDRYAEKCSGSQRMIFTDHLTEEEICALFQYADLFVYPTLSDTSPLVLGEAMASGLPVLTTRVGGIPYQVPLEAGILFERNDVEEFLRGLEQLTSDRRRLKQMGGFAKEWVKREFRWATSAKRAMGYYQEILADHHN